MSGGGGTIDGGGDGEETIGEDGGAVGEDDAIEVQETEEEVKTGTEERCRKLLKVYCQHLFAGSLVSQAPCECSSSALYLRSRFP